MCYGCENGMSEECWSYPSPDIDFDYQPRFTPPVDLTSYATGVSIGRLSASVQKTVDKKWAELFQEAGNMAIDREKYEVSRRFKEALELDAVQAEVSRRMGIMSDFGDDTWRVGTVFTFARSFGDGSKMYHYAVLKCENGKWYATGNDAVVSAGVTWRELLAWLVGHPTGSVITPHDVSVVSDAATYFDARSKA